MVKDEKRAVLLPVLEILLLNRKRLCAQEDIQDSQSCGENLCTVHTDFKPDWNFGILKVSRYFTFLKLNHTFLFVHIVQTISKETLKLK